MNIMEFLKALLPFLFTISKEGTTAEKGVPGGIATLDENGKIPHAQMPPACEIANGELVLNSYLITCEIENGCLSIST